jgi:hypothetical protein
MKKIPLVLLTIITTQIFAQINGVNIKVGKQFLYETKNNVIPKTFITPNNELIGIQDVYEGFYSVAFNSSELEIAHINDHQYAFKESNFDKMNGISIHKYIQIKDHIYALGLVDSKPNTSIVALPIDTKTGKPSNEIITLFSIPTEQISQDPYDIGGNGLYNFHCSFSM